VFVYVFVCVCVCVYMCIVCVCVVCGMVHVYICVCVCVVCVYVCMKVYGFKKKKKFLIACGSDGKESTCNAGDLGSIPGSGRSPGEGNGSPLQYSCLENSMDRGPWWATVHGIEKSQT